MNKNKLVVAFLLSFIFGFLVWHFSESLFGATEPWDTHGYSYIKKHRGLGMNGMSPFEKLRFLKR